MVPPLAPSFLWGNVPFPLPPFGQYLGLPPGKARLRPQSIRVWPTLKARTRG